MMRSRRLYEIDPYGLFDRLAAFHPYWPGICERAAVALVGIFAPVSFVLHLEQVPFETQVQLNAAIEGDRCLREWGKQSAQLALTNRLGSEVVGNTTSAPPFG